MLKKIPLIFGISALGLLTAVMVFSAVFPRHARGETQEATIPVDICSTFGSDNQYMNQDLDTEGVMSLYHETINTKFNEYIKKMLEGQKSAAEANQPDPNNKPPALEEGQICDENNYSTYCVAENLLSNGTYGYMAYVKALNCRRYSLFESTKQRTAWEDYSEAMITGTPWTPEDEAEAQFVQSLQGQRALEVSARLDAIKTEIPTSKQALDKTLSAYDELKTAWPMHQRYSQVYASLVKYRDKLVEIRHQIEEFPGKFIDATTTKCT